MRPRPSLRTTALRAAGGAPRPVGVLMLAIPASAVALTANPADARNTNRVAPLNVRVLAPLAQLAQLAPLTPRVHFTRRRASTSSAGNAGRRTAYRQSVASWYDDAGSTACGFHARLGVANRYLPCGTRVTLRYRAHTVAAVVDDRGPFTGGRDWDLNQQTAAAIGFSGVGAVWSSR